MTTTLTDDDCRALELPEHLKPLIPQAIETTDFDFASYLLTLPNMCLVHMIERSKDAKNPGAGYKFAFLIVGRTVEEFNALELRYANGQCVVEPVGFMQKRASLRAVMERKIRRNETHRPHHGASRR